MKNIKKKFRYFLQKVLKNVFNALLALSFITFLLAIFDVETLKKIEICDLSIFRTKGIRCKLGFYMTDPSMYDFDVIDSYAAMNRLRTKVLSDIRQTVKRENIERIHLVLATSSDFAFFLAQGFSQHHDPEIIVYQYEHSTSEKYPWGISNKQPPETAVINQRQNIN